jgi:hypothetical protein
LFGNLNGKAHLEVLDADGRTLMDLKAIDRVSTGIVWFKDQ